MHKAMGKLQGAAAETLINRCKLTPLTYSSKIFELFSIVYKYLQFYCMSYCEALCIPIFITEFWMCLKIKGKEAFMPKPCQVSRSDRCF